MPSNPLHALTALGQSIWYDNIQRSLLVNGELARMIREDYVTGLTSNPTIFEKAIAQSNDYDKVLTSLLQDSPRADAPTLYEALTVQDIQAAADLLRPVYDQTNGADGYASLEVSPLLAHDTEGSINEGRRLFQAVDRPNLMIKIPATPAGLPAIQTLISEGINVNVTLMFSLQHYEDVVDAYLAGLEAWTGDDDLSKVASVASFFVSRVDTIFDKALEAISTTEAMALQGKIAIANAKVTYQRFESIFNSKRFQKLQERGARPQRVVWASTSTKNPHYSDVLYVEAVIGPGGVNTVPAGGGEVL
jgi:transaldolase